MNNATSESKPESFTSLCKQLGQAIRGSATQNALLCYRAQRAYVDEYPETGQGKARTKAKSDRVPSFREAAAKESGVCASTIDALLQVGKAIHGLPKTVQHALVSSSLGNEVRVLRKLATSKFEKKRATLILAFIQKEKTDRNAAMRILKKTLQLTAASKSQNKSPTTDGKPKMVFKPETQQLSPGEFFDVAVEGYVFRMAVGRIVDGQITLTAMVASGDQPKAVTLLESVSAGRAPKVDRPRVIKPANRGTAKLAA